MSILAVDEAATSRKMIARLRALHPFPMPVVDVTFGQGNFWVPGDEVIGVDANTNADIKARWENLPFKTGSIGTIVFDPPHTADDGKQAWKDAYGQTTAMGNIEEALIEFRRVLQTEGLLLTKTADMIHSQRASWLTWRVMDAARSAGFRLEDWLIGYRRSIGHPDVWKTQRHARKNHSHWQLWVPTEAKLW